MHSGLGQQDVPVGRLTDSSQPKAQLTMSPFMARATKDFQQNMVSQRRAEALPAAQTDIPRERVTVKFNNEDAEAVMAKALEGGSDSKKEEPLSPEPLEIPAPLEAAVEAMKRDGGEKKPSGEETPSKKQKVLFTDEKRLGKVKAFPSTPLPAGLPNPITPIQSSLRSPSAPSRTREAVELLEEESPMKKLRPADDSEQQGQDQRGESWRR